MPEDWTGSDLPSVVYHKNREWQARAVLLKAPGGHEEARFPTQDCDPMFISFER
jgi:hypothetical protein